MANFRGEKLTELFREAAAAFLQQEGTGSALLTVTRVTVSDDGKYATIFFTVFPADKEAGALDFAKRKRADFKAYVKAKTRIGRIPFFDFEIDAGEKNRQHLDELGWEDKERNGRKA